jgi:hypothetical protein
MALIHSHGATSAEKDAANGWSEAGNWKNSAAFTATNTLRGKPHRVQARGEHGVARFNPRAVPDQTHARLRHLAPA